jgi:hypothetical protein
VEIRPSFEPEPEETAPRPPIWRVPGRVIVAKFALAAFVTAIALWSGDRVATAVGLVAAAGLVVYAVRDLIARDRLVADADGVTVVRGYAGRRRLAWSELERVRVDSRDRLGATTRMLEFDAGAEIYMLSQYDLGEDPRAVLARLTELRGERDGLGDRHGAE